MKKLFTLTLAVAVSTSAMAYQGPKHKRVAPNKVENRIDRLLDNSDHSFRFLVPFDANYLAYSYFNKNLNFEQDKMLPHELKGQISFAVPLYRGLWDNNSLIGFAITYKLLFQIANSPISAPFRTSDYSTKLFLAWKKEFPLFLGLKTTFFEAGYWHESNGFGLVPEGHSRSWDRAYVTMGFAKGDFFGDISLWTKLPESIPLFSLVDNPTIYDHRSYGNITLGYRFKDHTIKAIAHYNPLANKGGMELSYNYAINRYLGFYVQGFSGYGESLLDYNKLTHRIGIGFSFADIY